MSSEEEKSHDTIINEGIKLKEHRKKRGIAKGKLTLLKKYVASLQPDSFTAEQCIDLEMRIERLKLVFNDFELNQDAIETIVNDVEEEMKERANFEDEYYKTMAKAREYINQRQRAGGMQQQATHSALEMQTDSIKYPDIILPTFSGNTTEWIEFRDTFNAIVNQGSLKPIQKYKYLRSCLKDSALEVIGALEYAEESYAIAWQLLCERYNNPKLLVNNHLHALFQDAQIPSTPTALKGLLDNISKHMRTLKSINIDTDNWDLLVIYFISKKLDRTLLNKWEEKWSKDLPTLQDFKTFLRNQADLLEISTGQPNRDLTRGEIKAHSNVATNKVTNLSISNSKCPYCHSKHYLNQCPKFLALDTNMRNKAVRSMKVCLNCFRTNHTVALCRASACRSCNGKHNTLLHYTANQKPTTLHSEPTHEGTSTSRQVTNTTVNSKPNNESTMQMREVLLSTAQVTVLNNRNQPQILRVLLDSGSQSNFITKNAYDKLGVPQRDVDMEVVGFNGNATNIQSVCDIQIQSIDKTYTNRVSCLIVPTICKLPSYTQGIKQINIPKRYKLADENFYLPGEIDIIVGAELFYSLLCVGQQRLGEGLPTLQKTKLGWVVSGPLNSSIPKSIKCNFILNNMVDFWGIETQTNPNSVSAETIECEQAFSRHTRTQEGNFVVELPLKKPIDSLGESRGIAYKRMKALEQKFHQNRKLKTMYTDFMREFEKAGHMVKLDSSGPKANAHTSQEIKVYLPHHAIVNETKSTPIRVVFDASCPTSTGVSLNDIQYKGNTLQDDLCDILLRFRMHRYVVNADIKNFYRMIFLTESQRNLQCILWRESPKHRMDTYMLTTLSFGLRCAPNVAVRCLLELSNQCMTEFPEAAKVIRQNFMMDDLLYGGDDQEAVIQTMIQVRDILSKAKFTLRKWKSNCEHITKAVSTEPELLDSLPVEIGAHKVLGLAWSSTNDQLGYTTELKPVPQKLTKRIVLSITAGIFDPLGLLGPIIIRAKLFIQKLWGLPIGWDDLLPNTYKDEWQNIYNSLSKINIVKVPRHVVIPNYKTIELHGFSDSSMSGYGASIYVRSIDNEGKIYTQLLCAKSRVARKETIPRLELRAALLLANLMKKVKKAINYKISKTYLWSDSNVALAWINTDPLKLNCFVSNRVKEIQNITNLSDWGWVCSSENPADILSRGTTAEKLAQTDLWFHGPTWLSRPIIEWPSRLIPVIQTPLPEVKQQTLTANVTTQEETLHQNLIQRYSSLEKLVRVFSYINRFIHNIKCPQTKTVGILSVKELQESLNSLLKHIQIERFQDEYNQLNKGRQVSPHSRLANLDPIFDDGLIRVGGRLKLSNYSYNKKHPIILPSDHTLTKLIVRSQHIKLLHCGPQLLLSSLRERYWPIHGKVIVNKVVRECMVCARAKPITTIPKMGNLPVERVNPSPPFDTTCIDYAGPFAIRDRRGRGYKTYKCWVALLVCCSTKAVHIELISSLESAAFIAALRRFLARRGKPRQIISDNSTTFHGANRELKELYNHLKESSIEIGNECANQGILWKFLTAYTPHMGGLHEAAVRACKFHLKRVLGQALLTYEEFATILTQIEGILNSRPLCPIPNSDNDNYPVLTPAHFLIGRSMVALPDNEATLDLPSNRLTHYEQLQQIQRDFWRRWSRDYIGLLQQRVKWHSSAGPALQPGLLVLLKDERLPPCRWRLGRIVGTSPGRDGLVRVATVRTQGGDVRRAFNTICPLPLRALDTDEHDDDITQR